MNHDVNSDPNESYAILEKSITSAMDEHMPLKTVKLNKYKHKGSPWITQDIINSIKYRDKLYKKVKSTSQNSPKYGGHKRNLATCNSILSKSIRIAKQNYFRN